MATPKGDRPHPWLTPTIAALAFIFGCVLWPYLQMRHWKDPGEDSVLIARDIVLFVISWGLLGWAVLLNVRDARRAKSKDALIETLKDEHAIQLRKCESDDSAYPLSEPKDKPARGVTAGLSQLAGKLDAVLLPQGAQVGQPTVQTVSIRGPQEMALVEGPTSGQGRNEYDVKIKPSFLRFVQTVATVPVSELPKEISLEGGKIIVSVEGTKVVINDNKATIPLDIWIDAEIRRQA